MPTVIFKEIEAKAFPIHGLYGVRNLIKEVESKTCPVHSLRSVINMSEAKA